MSGAAGSGTRPSALRGAGPPGHPHDARDWPRDFGRDGVSGLVTLDRAMRSRDVSRPDSEDERMASDVLAQLLARVDGRRQSRTSV